MYLDGLKWRGYVIAWLSLNASEGRINMFKELWDKRPRILARTVVQQHSSLCFIRDKKQCEELPMPCDTVVQSDATEQILGTAWVEVLLK